MPNDPTNRESVRALLESSTLYRVDAYPYGGAFDDDGTRALVTADLERALEDLADRVDAYADYLHQGADIPREEMYRLVATLERMDREGIGPDGLPARLEDRESIREEIREELEELEEEDRAYASAFGWMDALYASARAWSTAVARSAGRSYGSLPSRGALEYLETSLQHAPRYAGDAYAPVRLVSPILESVDEPGSFARGMRFELETVALADLGSLEELESYAPELLASILEELEELPDEMTGERCARCGEDLGSRYCPSSPARERSDAIRAYLEDLES